MNFFRKCLLSITAAAALALSAVPTAQAGPLGHSSAAAAHSGQASAHAGAAVVSGAAVVVAVPLLTIGSVGEASGKAGAAMLDAAVTPLPIGHQVEQTTPSPADILKQKGKQ